MPRQLQHAYFNLAVAVLTGILYLATLPFLGPTRATGAFGLLGFTALGLIFYRRRAGQVVSDERDRAIHAQSIKAVAAVLWLLLIAGGWSLCLVYRHAGAVPITALVNLMWIAWIAVLLVQSLAIIVQYRRSA